MSVSLSVKHCNHDDDNDGNDNINYAAADLVLMMTIITKMMITTIARTNDVCDKEGKPADDEDAHHRSQSLCSFCLF